MSKRLPLLVLIAAAGYGAYYYVNLPPKALVLTGIVTTHDVTVAPQIGGRVVSLLVKEGDAVKKGQAVAEIDPGELRAERAYYEHSAEGIASQVRESEAALRLQERQLTDQVKQAEAAVATSEAQRAAAAAEVERAKVTVDRTRELFKQQLAPAQSMDEARTAYEAAVARMESTARQIDAAKAAVELARSNFEQVSVRRSQVQTSQHQLAAVGSQRDKADVRLAFTNVVAPIDGIVDVQPARQGEVVNSGQTLLTLIDQDDLWVRADIEETYIDRVRIGDTLTVRLPSGEERTGTVFYRRADASFATQRDVSRTKRDIKTFETRLRLDNKDRRLAVGMTVYVMLPLQGA
ncbi:MAG TPA: HlyD family efflux transporter periplasmic adaptor subunit [Vicinamibacterales bacterium]